MQKIYHIMNMIWTKNRVNKYKVGMCYQALVSFAFLLSWRARLFGKAVCAQTIVAAVSWLFVRKDAVGAAGACAAPSVLVMVNPCSV